MRIIKLTLDIGDMSRLIKSIVFAVGLLVMVSGLCYGGSKDGRIHGDLIDDYSKSPISFQRRPWSEWFITHCLNHGVNLVDPETGVSLLHIAAYENRALDVERLIEGGADVDLQYMDGSTALADAAYEGHADVVDLLIRKGADVNRLKPDFNGLVGASPLLYAIAGYYNAQRPILNGSSKSFVGKPGHIKIVKALITAGADVNLADSNGVTPLFAVALHGYSPIVKILLKNGADYHATIDMAFGRTGPFSLEDVATMRGAHNLARIFRDMQGFVDVGGKAGDIAD